MLFIVNLPAFARILSQFLRFQWMCLVVLWPWNVANKSPVSTPCVVTRVTDIRAGLRVLRLNRQVMIAADPYTLLDKKSS